MLYGRRSTYPVSQITSGREMASQRRVRLLGVCAQGRVDSWAVELELEGEVCEEEGVMAREEVEDGDFGDVGVNSTGWLRVETMADAFIWVCVDALVEL